MLGFCMVIDIDPDVNQRLERLAAERGASASDIIAEALDALEPASEEEIASVKAAMDEADRDGWLTIDEVRAHLDQTRARMQAALKG